MSAFRKDRIEQDIDIEDAPIREPIRPHALSWSARYADRDWFSRSKYYRARREQNVRRRDRTRKTVSF